MANSRHFQTFYGATTKHQLGTYLYDRRGRAASLLGALQAAVRRVSLGQWARCDIYHDDGRLLYTVTRSKRVVTLLSRTRSSLL